MTSSSARGRIVLVLASTLIALLAAEVALRVLSIAPARYQHARNLETDDKRLGLDLYPDDPSDAFPVDLTDEETRRGYRARGLDAVDAHFERTPHGVELRYSEELCRGGDIAARREGTARVLLIGDSFTEGQGVVEEDTAARLLASRLEDVEVVNCARRGYDFPALRAWFDRRLALEPDVVVYAMVLNDPQQGDAFHARQRYIDDWIVDRRRMVESVEPASPLSPRLFALLSDRVEGLRVGRETTRWYQEMVGPENAAGWEATLDAVEAMDIAMRARGGALVVALWPLLVDLGDDYPFEATHRTIAEAMAARGVTFSDTLPAFRGLDETTLWVHPVDRHPNARAQAIFAAALEPLVRRALAARAAAEAP